MSFQSGFYKARSLRLLVLPPDRTRSLCPFYNKLYVEWLEKLVHPTVEFIPLFRGHLCGVVELSWLRNTNSCIPEGAQLVPVVLTWNMRFPGIDRPGGRRGSIFRLALLSSRTGGMADDCV